MHCMGMDTCTHKIFSQIERLSFRSSLRTVPSNREYREEAVLLERGSGAPGVSGALLPAKPEIASFYSDTQTTPVIFFISIFKDIDACHCRHSTEEALHSWDRLFAKWDSLQIDLF